jgi:hypothetical protein
VTLSVAGAATPSTTSAAAAPATTSAAATSAATTAEASASATEVNASAAESAPAQFTGAASKVGAGSLMGLVVAGAVLGL